MTRENMTSAHNPIIFNICVFYIKDCLHFYVQSKYRFLDYWTVERFDNFNLDEIVMKDIICLDFRLLTHLQDRY